MSKVVRFFGIQRVMNTMVAAMSALLLAGCGQRDDVQIKLHTRQIPNSPLNFVEVQAQVAGPLTGLRYKWFADSGECDPQEGDQPKTVFKFMEGVRHDHVSVEVWRNNKRLALGEIKVKFDETAHAQAQGTSGPVIEIMTIPPLEPGGPDTRADIGGRVGGDIPADCLVVIYARAYGYWYVQPGAGSLLAIRPDNTWWSWTHTGTKYAALLVRPKFEPLERMEMLPQTNNVVLACAIVDGVAKDKSTNAVTNADLSLH